MSELLVCIAKLYPDSGYITPNLFFFRFVVARAVEATTSEYRSLATHAPIIPTKMLSDPEELERQLIQTSIPLTNDFIVDVDQLISPHVNIKMKTNVFLLK